MIWKIIFIQILSLIANECRASQTLPLYRCLSTDNKDHFLSSINNCEGQKVEYLMGYILDSPQPNIPTTPLYRCSRLVGSNVDHFTSVDANCEGHSTDVLLGYTYTNKPKDVPTKQLYRCLTNDGSDHFESYIDNCENQIKEGFIAGFIRVNA
jgi:hypothetical protein